MHGIIRLGLCSLLSVYGAEVRNWGRLCLAVRASYVDFAMVSVDGPAEGFFLVLSVYSAKLHDQVMVF